MKKGFTNRFLAVLAVATLTVVGAIGQTHVNTITKRVDYAGDSAVTVQITTGKSLPVFVTPDSYYHPNWNATSTLTDDFVWNYTFAGTNIDTAGQVDNYIVVTAGGVGAVGTTTTLLATEEAPAAYGGCVSAPASGIDFEVVAIPTVTSPTTTYYKLCDGDAGPATISATLNGTSSFNLVWDVRIFNTTTADTVNATDTYDNTLTAAGNTTTWHSQYTAASPQSVAASGAYDLMGNASVAIGQADFVVRNDMRTVYEFVVKDVNDLVSRKSDFLALTGTATASITDDQYVYYDVAGVVAPGGTASHTVQVVVLPAPATGPIYHIPANWAN